jgi:hypothetical protein
MWTLVEFERLTLLVGDLAFVGIGHGPVLDGPEVTAAKRTLP